MPTILAIQHVEPESPAPVAAVLESCGVSVRTLRIDDGEPVSREPGAHSGLLIMGGPMSVYEQARHPFLAEEIRLIKRFVDCEIPILGICLGSQLLAAALGARVQPGRSPEIGWLPVRLTKDANADALWHGVPSPLVPLHWHGDVFDLPRDAVTLASSELTPVQAFRFRSNAYGLLFHIEATLQVVETMCAAFPEDPLRGGQSAESILRDAPRHVAALSPLAHKVFSRWAALVMEHS